METPQPPLPVPTMHPIPGNSGSADVVPSAVVEAGSAADKADATTTVPPITTVPSTRKEGHRRSKKKKATGAAVPSFSEKKLAHLVIDSGAIIKGAGMTLAAAAEVWRRMFCLETNSNSSCCAACLWWWWTGAWAIASYRAGAVEGTAAYIMRNTFLV